MISWQLLDDGCINLHILNFVRILDCRYTFLPIKFSHAFLHQAVVGVAQPVVGLALGKGSQRFKAVYKCYDARIVLGQIGLIHHVFGFDIVS